MSLYRAIDVWRRVDDSTIVRYRCFESLLTGKYSVQSSDSYKAPIDPKQRAYLDDQFLELLLEQDPSERSGEFATLQDAIAAHDQKFS